MILKQPMKYQHASILLSGVDLKSRMNLSVLNL